MLNGFADKSKNMWKGIMMGYKDTRCVDEAICPKCRNKFSGVKAMNYETGTTKRIRCPHCRAEIEIYASVEYQCSIATEDLSEDLGD
jgi:DNA-directed RNA polymerase subunit RPC12/RpoP